MEPNNDAILRPGMRVDSLPPAAEHMEEYEYTPLPTPTSIRVLRIDDRSSNGLIYCSMKVVDLKDRPLYHTFSYTWGNPFPDSLHFRKNYEAADAEYAVKTSDPIHAISCDGKLIYVNRNLYEALYSIPEDAWVKRCDRRDLRNHSRTTLHEAVITGNVDLVHSLICARVDINVVDEFGRTPLSYVTQSGSLTALKLLLRAGAEINIADNNNKTVLEYAQDEKRTDIIKYLEELENTDDKSGTEADALPDGPQIWAWIDQICIDQRNIEERSSQVGMMDQVYESSDFTLNWLGREDEHTEIAIQTIIKYDSACGDALDSRISPYCDEAEEVYAKAGIPYISTREWEAVAALFLRRYFRRLWVIQENILSRITVGYCGMTEVPWEAFCRFAKHLYDNQIAAGFSTSTNYINRDQAAHCIEEEVVAVARWKERLVSQQAGIAGQMKFENLLFDTWSFHATDPRDKIFGLYGLLSKIGYSKWHPDYSKPVEQVYAEATQYSMEESGDFRLLSAAIDVVLRRNKDLPSWVPDYGTPFTNMMCAIFNAAGNLPLRPPKCIQRNVLGVTGIKIDSVLQIGNMTQRSGDMAMFFDPCWFELTLLLTNPYPPTGQPRTECLWRTLLADQDNTASFPAPGWYHDAFRRMLLTTACVKIREGFRIGGPDLDIPASLAKMLGIVRGFMSEPPMCDFTSEQCQEEFGHPGKNLSGPNHQGITYLFFKLQLLAQAEANPATPSMEQVVEKHQSIDWDALGPMGVMAEPDDKPFFDSLRSKYGRRRLFVTEKRYLGLGPASMVEGDEVWVIPGAGAAFVLRQVDGEDSFRLVGEAYVHGVMHGEAVEGREGEVREINLI